MARLKKKPRDITKIQHVDLPRYKTRCDICGKTNKQTTIWSYLGRKSGRMRGACKRHLKKAT